MRYEKENPSAGTPELRRITQAPISILPQAENSEIQVLGSIILGGTLIEQVSLSPSDFYTEKHQAIFSVMKDAERRRIPIAIDTLSEEIKKADKEEITGGSKYLTYVERLTPTTANLSYHVEKVKEASYNRKLWVALEDIKQAIERGAGSERIKEGLHYLYSENLQSESRLKPISARDLPDTQQVDSLWGEAFYPGCITQVNSEPGVGKTTLLYNICACGARGEDFLDIPFLKAIKILYFDLETAKWLRRAKLERILGTEDLPGNLYFLDALDFERDFHDLLALCKREKYDLVIFDTQSRVLAMDKENDNAEANKMLSLMRRLTIETDCALGLVHHSGKTENSKSVYKGRGASAIAGGVDVVINLDALDEDTIKLTVGKNRIIGTNPTLYLRKVGEDIFESYTPPGESSGFEIFKAQKAILSLNPEKIWETGEIKEAVPFAEATTERAIRRLVESGQLVRVGRGKYQIRAYHHEASKHHKHHIYIADASDASDASEAEDYKIPEVIA